jgi:hypothetical protein
MGMFSRAMRQFWRFSLQTILFARRDLLRRFGACLCSRGFNRASKRRTVNRTARQPKSISVKYYGAKEDPGRSANSQANLEIQPFRAGMRQEKASGSQVTPASLLQFHEPDDSGFNDLRLRDKRDIFRLSSCHIFASIPTCRKGDVLGG